ncbi:alpha/beta hydrolase [[Pseudomonas] boreopolis]|uniref:Alpha/beta hydrolase n=1 Tax=Xanthomonas boreopolis TaxID=86183 RepID=A0A919KK16_9XANT|nr:alpha/beta hydrolase [[Pseudomonas] boreopolis]
MSLQEFACGIRLGQVRGLRAERPGGRKVLALHGWLDNANSFAPMAPYLDDLDLVLLDLPGHGHSDSLPAGSEYTMIGAIHSVLDAADALGWERFTLLGHSMGAGIASFVAAAEPARVEALVAIEALGGLGESVENTVDRLRQSVTATRSLPQRPLRVFPTLETAVRARMMANQLSEAAARLLVERGVQTVPGGYSWRTDQRLTLPTAVRMTEAQIDALVAAIECPTQVIFATPAQPYFPEPLRSRRVTLLPRGRLATLAGIHHLHMEEPAAVAAIVREFLQALPG